VVRDSAKRPIRGADVTIVEGINRIVQQASTDSAGFVTIRSTDSTLQIVVRKIGFRRESRFVLSSLGSSDTISIVLTPAPQTLATVTVTADEDVKRKSYFIDADEIAKTDRTLEDASDIVAKLRRDMVTSRAPEVCADSLVTGAKAARRHPPAGGLSNIWINGRRIRLVEPPRWVSMPYGLEAFVRQEILDILKSIHPEHIESMTYTDCFDTSVPRLGGQNALFIVLKPGVTYDRSRGSWIQPSLATAGDGADQPGTLPALPRGRLVGVYDKATGEPIADVEIRDLINGVRAQTTTTGTAAIGFAGDEGTVLRFVKPGYDTLRVPLSKSLSDTTPLTLVLEPRDSSRAGAVSSVDSNSASGKASGTQVIDDRQLRTANDRAFVDVLRANLRGIQIVPGPNGAQYLMRLPECVSGEVPAVYLDGVRLPATFGAPDFGRANVGALETSIAGRIVWTPIEVGGTESRRPGSCGALIISPRSDAGTRPP
jgi:hypothetical protein